MSMTPRTYELADGAVHELDHDRLHQPLDDDDDVANNSSDDEGPDELRPHDSDDGALESPAVSSARSFASEPATTSETTPLLLDESESIWSRPEHKLAAFAFLLLDEFLVAYQLSKAARALKDELIERKLGVPSRSAELWCELHHSCRTVLGRKSSSKSAGASTTLEQLLEFCTNSSAIASNRRGFALDLLSHSPVSVCASPKKSSKRSSAFSLMDAHIQMLRSPVVRPSRRSVSSAAAQDSTTGLTSSASAPVLATSHGASSSAVVSSPVKAAPAVSAAKKAKKKRKHGAAAAMTLHRQQVQHHHPESYYYVNDKPHTNGHFGGSQTNVSVHASFEARTYTPGSYVEPALVLAHEAQLKRELSSVRILERELRHIRLEKIANEPKRALVKRLGFASMNKAEVQYQREKQDPYLNDLVLEKLGFSKRSDCALCQFSFLQVNLPHKVSFKCIMDVYAKWQYEPPDRESASKYRAPLCYDAVQVCRMCAQIVLEHTAAAAVDTTRASAMAMSSQQQQQSQRRVSPKTKRGSTPSDSSFCSDPYALPPLFADDCYDERSAAQRLDDAHEEHRSVPLVESPAKAIVYANQGTELSQFMTSKEWEVINPQRSFIRAAIESTVKKSSTGGANSTLVAALSNASRSAGK